MDDKKIEEIKEKVKEKIAYELVLAITNAKLELTEIVGLLVSATGQQEKQYQERRKQLTNVIPVLESRLKLLRNVE